MEPIVSLFGTIAVSLLTIFLVDRYKAMADLRRADAAKKLADAEYAKTDQTIDNANISTALLLLDRVRHENMELSARAAMLEEAATKLGEEVKTLRGKLRDSEDCAKRLWYQLKAASISPSCTPTSITGPLDKAIT